MYEISRIDIGIILCYLLGMIGVGLWSSGKVKNLADYALAGKTLGYPIMIGTLVGAVIGAASTIGKAGKAYEMGIFLFVVSLGYGTGLILFGFFSRKLREIEIWTIPDALKKRYGEGIDLVMGIAMMLTVIAVFGGQIIGMGMIFSSVGKSFGITYSHAIILAGGVLIFYTIIGGLLAVAYTDMIQSLIMIVGIGFILPAAVMSKASDMGNMWEFLKPEPGNLLGGMTPLYIISIFIIDCSFCLVDPSLWQRANAARNDSIIKRSMFVTTGVYFYWSVICVILGVLGAVLIPNLAEQYGSNDAVISVLTVNYLPPIVVGFCLTGLMAVMMSTASVALLISGTTVANDLIGSIRPGISERGLLIAAKITILIVGVFGVFFALFMKGIFDIMLLAFAIYVSGVFVPTMAALYWEKATRKGAIASSVVATIVVMLLYALKKPFGIEPIMVSLLVSLILMVVVSLIIYKPELATPRLLPKG